MNTYLSETLSKLKSSGAISPDPLAEIANHKTLSYLSEPLDALEDENSIELAEFVAGLVLVAYQEGFEIGWDGHKTSVREMD